jgi:hypothetical protein
MTPEVADLDFFEHNTPCLYGDDVLNGVSDYAAEYFNNIVYAKLCKDVYLMEYTTGAKEIVNEPFIPRQDMSFLKRKFVYRKDFDRVVAPLDLNSIVKSLVWFIPSQAVTQEKQLRDTCTSALWELFFHCDSKQFHTMRMGLIKMVCETFGVYEFELEHEFPTYNSILEALCF